MHPKTVEIHHRFNLWKKTWDKKSYKKRCCDSNPWDPNSCMPMPQEAGLEWKSRQRSTKIPQPILKGGQRVPPILRLNTRWYFTTGSFLQKSGPFFRWLSFKKIKWHFNRLIRKKKKNSKKLMKFKSLIVVSLLLFKQNFPACFFVYPRDPWQSCR